MPNLISGQEFIDNLSRKELNMKEEEARKVKLQEEIEANRKLPKWRTLQLSLSMSIYWGYSKRCDSHRAWYFQ